ncbi:MAG: CARDB domain-containing protein, partial [Chloroflexota bacterium]
SFFIDGEPTLVMNGFDLSSQNFGGAVVMDRVTIAVQQAVPEQAIQVVIYEDTNGGSPQDAVLAYQTSVIIQSAGTAFIDLPNPVTLTAPVVWVGFYLPSGFRFFADESGSSVLTYWAWTPGTTFDLSNLSTATVFGPADGSEPVNVNQNGVARITAEVTPVSADLLGDGTNASGAPVGIQIDGGDESLAVLQEYPYCGERLIYDPEDVEITGRLQFTTHCRADIGLFQPGEFINQEDLPATVPSFDRRGFFYEIFVNGDTTPDSSEEMIVPVTHCLRPEQGEIETAVIGIAYGAPRQWEMLPTVRYGEWVCAEVTHAGFISYFVPRTGDEPTLNADLYFSGVPFMQSEFWNDETENFYCGYEYRPTFNIFNLGFEPTPVSVVRVQVINQRTGTIIEGVDYTLPVIQPGTTVNFYEAGFVMPDIFINEDTTVRFIIDPENVIAEANETNNIANVDGGILRFTDTCRTLDS